MLAGARAACPDGCEASEGGENLRTFMRRTLALDGPRASGGGRRRSRACIGTVTAAVAAAVIAAVALVVRAFLPPLRPARWRRGGGCTRRRRLRRRLGGSEDRKLLDLLDLAVRSRSISLDLLDLAVGDLHRTPLAPLTPLDLGARPEPASP